MFGLRFRKTEMSKRIVALMRAIRKPEIVQPIMERVGLYGRTLIVRNFRAEGTMFGDKWARIGWVTALFRKGGKFVKGGYTAAVKDPKAFVDSVWAAVRDRAKKSRPLNDTGDAQRSFLGTGRGAVLDAEGLRVRVGSNLDYLKVHQRGGSSKFDLNADKMEQLERVIPPFFPGAAPKTGKATKRWNPAFFSFLGALKKLDGKRRPIPQRKMVPDPEDLKREHVKHMEKIITDGYSKIPVRDTP